MTACIKLEIQYLYNNMIEIGEKPKLKKTVCQKLIINLLIIGAGAQTVGLTVFLLALPAETAKQLMEFWRHLSVLKKITNIYVLSKLVKLVTREKKHDIYEFTFYYYWTCQIEILIYKKKKTWPP